MVSKEGVALDFYKAVAARRTVRDFTEDVVEPEKLKRILSAGLQAPTNDHMRSWEFIVLTDKAKIETVLKKIPKKVSEKRVDFILKAWRMTDPCQQAMYKDGIPKQYQMLSRSGCLILPLFKHKGKFLQPKNLSALNGFASIWCCIENILLAATAEGLGCALRIPLGDEPEYIAETLGYPKGYVLPCYIAMGYPAHEAVIPEQKPINIEDKLHLNAW